MLVENYSILLESGLHLYTHTLARTCDVLNICIPENNSKRTNKHLMEKKGNKGLQGAFNESIVNLIFNYHKFPCISYTIYLFLYHNRKIKLLSVYTQTTMCGVYVGVCVGRKLYVYTFSYFPKARYAFILILFY